MDKNFKYVHRMSRYESYGDYREAWGKAPNSTPPIPLNVDIELCALCNLRCPFCFIADPTYKNPGRMMAYDVAMNLIEESAALGIPALKFNWRGESTLHPSFSTILRKARSYPFHDIIVNTNGNCPEHSIDGLMQTTKVIISLDSLVQSTYRQIRIGGNFFKAINTINLLSDMKHPDIMVRRVITKDNKNEDFIGLAKARWGNRVKASEHYCFDRNTTASCQSTAIPDARTYCGYPSQRIVVAVNGVAYPCCVDTNGTMPVGQYPRQSLREIWNGEKLRALRMELKRNEFWSDTCRHCTSWMAYNSKEREFVEDKHARTS